MLTSKCQVIPDDDYCDCNWIISSRKYEYYEWQKESSGRRKRTETDAAFISRQVCMTAAVAVSRPDTTIDEVEHLLNILPTLESDLDGLIVQLRDHRGSIAEQQALAARMRERHRDIGRFITVYLPFPSLFVYNHSFVWLESERCGRRYRATSRTATVG